MDVTADVRMDGRMDGRADAICCAGIFWRGIFKSSPMGVPRGVTFRFARQGGAFGAAGSFPSLPPRVGPQTLGAAQAGYLLAGQLLEGAFRRSFCRATRRPLPSALPSIVTSILTSTVTSILDGR